MKKNILITGFFGLFIYITLFLFTNKVNAEYLPSAADIKLVNQLHTKIDMHYYKNGEQSLQKLADRIREIYWVFSHNERVCYVFDQMLVYLDKRLTEWYDDMDRIFAQLDLAKNKTTKSDKEYATKVLNSKQNVGDNMWLSENLSATQKIRKVDFFNKHGQEILWLNEIPDRCLTHYDFVDNIAKQHDFPTPLIIATWYREHTCRLDNPKNWDWAFQIRSNYYAPWDITLQELQEQIIHFIEFSRAKHRSYRRPHLLWDEAVLLTYNNYNLRSIQAHAILYNGVKKWTTLTTNYYANANINPSMSSRRDGVATMFLKILNREIHNK